MSQPILEAHDLVKKYGSLVAVNNISFNLEEGEIFGLLGPNGAGKSTTISMLTGLFPPDSGSIRIVGVDAVGDVEKVKQFIGVVPQELALYPALSGRENLRFFGEMYGLSGKRLKERVESALQVVAMTERANDRVQSYSGGMKRRINLAVGLINNPRILFLDEPTVGVDPQSRNHIFESVEKLNREQGMTILYTTHYMEEAERLCHRIAIVDHGSIIALDTPRNLIAMLGGGILKVGLARADETLCQAVNELSQVRAASFLPQAEAAPGADGPATAPPAGGTTAAAGGTSAAAGSTSAETGTPAADAPTPGRATLKVEARQANEALLQIIQLFNQRGVEILSIETLEPNLETVFLHLTGKSLRE